MMKAKSQTWSESNFWNGNADFVFQVDIFLTLRRAFWLGFFMCVRWFRGGGGVNLTHVWNIQKRCHATNIYTITKKSYELSPKFKKDYIFFMIKSALFEQKFANLFSKHYIRMVDLFGKDLICRFYWKKMCSQKIFILTMT